MHLTHRTQDIPNKPQLQRKHATFVSFIILQQEDFLQKFTAKEKFSFTNEQLTSSEIDQSPSHAYTRSVVRPYRSGYLRQCPLCE